MKRAVAESAVVFKGPGATAQAFFYESQRTILKKAD
jgi:hypothetical protein